MALQAEQLNTLKTASGLVTIPGLRIEVTSHD